MLDKHQVDTTSVTHLILKNMGRRATEHFLLIILSVPADVGHINLEETSCRGQRVRSGHTDMNMKRIMGNVCYHASVKIRNFYPVIKTSWTIRLEVSE